MALRNKTIENQWQTLHGLITLNYNQQDSLWFCRLNFWKKPHTSHNKCKTCPIKNLLDLNKQPHYFSDSILHKIAK